MPAIGNIPINNRLDKNSRIKYNKNMYWPQIGPIPRIPKYHDHTRLGNARNKYDKNGKSSTKSRRLTYPPPSDKIFVVFCWWRGHINKSDLKFSLFPAILTNFHKFLNQLSYSNCVSVYGQHKFKLLQFGLISLFYMSLFFSEQNFLYIILLLAKFVCVVTFSWATFYCF